MGLRGVFFAYILGVQDSLGMFSCWEVGVTTVSPLFAVTAPPHDITSDEGFPDIGSKN